MYEVDSDLTLFIQWVVIMPKPFVDFSIVLLLT